jgi:hypothetical protein
VATRSHTLAGGLRSQIKAALHGTLPASAMGKACTYTLSLWQKLNRFLEHPQLELSNNLAENSMRPIALGRKNWIHLASQQAGPKIAAILSVMETCKRLNIPVREYLAHVLPRLANLPAIQLEQLTLSAWQTTQLINTTSGLKQIGRWDWTLPLLLTTSSQWNNSMEQMGHLQGCSLMRVADCH